jgi:LysR family hca operon transcriptional activator
VGTPGAREKDFVSWGACLEDMEAVMELRHLRYFVAVADAGSLTVAAEKKLHTAQPSLSRQIRDLEYEVGVPLMNRSVHGIELTAAGRAFLDHARLALTQAEAAAEAARRAAQRTKPTFAIGFQTGQEVDWLPRATSVLRDELLNIEIRVSSDHSTTLADDLQRGKLDIAFLRREQKPDLEYKIVAKEPLVVFLPSDHPLAEHKAIDPHDLVGETFIGISEIPRVLRAVINAYLKRTGIELKPHLEIDNFAMAISLVASTRGVALLPASAENFLTWSVVVRPLKGETPTIDLVVGYHKANTSPILRTFLSKIDDLTTRISSKARDLRT